MTAWKRPDKIEPGFKAFYEELVKRTGDDAPITSDWRTPTRNEQVGGVKGGLHTRGTAVDRPLPKGANALWRYVVALVHLVEELGLDNEIELELVNSKKDRHLHVGLNRNKPGGKLIVAAD